MAKKLSKNQIRQRRHLRVRKHISGTPERPRLNVFRSLSNIYAQIIDDTTGNTLVSASTLDQAIKDKIGFGGNVAAAKEVGKLVAEKAIAAGITTVVFDRSGYVYHGRVKELADAAREAGLTF